MRVGEGAFARSIRGGMLKEFGTNRQGSIAIAFGLSVFVLVAFVGAGVEFSRASAVRDQIIVAADTAVLQAVTAVDARHSQTWSRGDPDAEAIMRASFARAKAAIEEQNGTTINATMSFERVRGLATAEICFEARVPTIFSVPPVGAVIPVSRCVRAESAPPTFVEVHIYLDASGSMGIGASARDQDIMQRTVGCMFACHTINWKSVRDPRLCSQRTWFAQTTHCAALNGAETRFDVARQAIVAMLRAAQGLPPDAGQFAFSIHKFSNYVTVVHPLSRDYDSLIQAVLALEMDVEGAGTNIRGAMLHAERQLPRQRGDGSSSERALQHVFLITDGLENNIWEVRDGARPSRADGEPFQYNGAWRQDPDLVLTTPGFWQGSQRNQVFDDVVCDRLKERGARISTLALRYVVPGNAGGHLRRIGDELVPRISERMQVCATSRNLAYEANDPDEVRRAIDTMFWDVVNQARLTH